ncbi:helix-turn-helix transcriptional regulator [Streptomyces cavernae]|uniref:helix-turn-helix transcriptional regulator n=1 Tax=Streptomyces cavernae TaxID=2259034 RepID=UPI000FEBCDC2|nr:helix-turn-helix transcriptional regulator [Streptomyces cavernae]
MSNGKFAPSVLAVAALRRGDLVSAARHIETVDDGSLDSSSPDELAHYHWLVLQLAAASIGSRRAVERFMAEQPGTLMDGTMLSVEPGSAAWLVRVLLRADDRPAAESVVRAAGTEPQPGTLHARSLLDKNAMRLGHVIGHYRDPWARASAIEDLGVLLMTGPERRYRESEGRLREAADIYQEIGSVRDERRVVRRLREFPVRATGGLAARPAADTSWSCLTKSERAVARLVRQGLSNHQTASRLYISPHTVDFHLRRIYQKLGVRSRVQLASVLNGFLEDQLTPSE